MRLGQPLTVAWTGGGFVLTNNEGAEMIINLAETASNSMLDTIAMMMNGGAVELLADDGKVLTTLKLSTPAAKAAADGELVFNAIGEGFRTAPGTAETARIVGAGRAEVFSCDVGDENSDAVVKLDTVQFKRGAPIRI